MKKFIILGALLVSAISQAHARLGWTLDDCQSLWGAPTQVGYVSSIDQTEYTFRAQSNLFVQVYVLAGHVHNIVYASKDKTFLKNNASQLLQKNYPDAWNLYDDGRGKDTLYSWTVRDNAGQEIAYALFWNHPDANGFYKLQVASGLWDAFLQSRKVNRSSDLTYLNI